MRYPQKSLSTNWTLFLPWRWKCLHLLDQRGCLHALWLLLGCWCQASLQAACELQFPVHIKTRKLILTLQCIWGHAPSKRFVGEQIYACVYVPACQVVRGLCEPACGSPCCWRAKLWQPPGGWRVAGQWNLPLGCDHRHVIHSDRLSHEGPPIYTWKRYSENVKQTFYIKQLAKLGKKVTFDINTPGSVMPNGWLAWSLPPTMLRPRGPPVFTSVTSCEEDMSS